jgi:hypothetical protein
MLRLGIHVIPLEVRSKDAYWKNFQKMEMASETQILEWSQAHPDDNCGCIAKYETVWMLDVDCIELILEIERDTGHKMPMTLIVESGRVGGGAFHYYFLQTDASRKMKNGAIKGRGQWQVNNRYVVAAGSIHPSGKEYKSNGMPIVQAPDWLVEYLGSRETKGKERPVAEFKTEGFATEQREYVDGFLAANPWETRSGWLDYVAPEEQRGYKMYVRCFNEHNHTLGTGNDSSAAILVADHLGLDFKCQHHSCLHFVWEDFRAAVEAPPDISEWTKPRGNVDGTAAQAAMEKPATEEPEAPNVKTESRVYAGNEIPFPRDLMDCKLGKVARTFEGPPAWSFLSALAYYAGQGVPYVGSLPTNIFCTNLAESGGGKSLVAQRARETFIYNDREAVRDDLIISDNSLLLVLGGVKVADLTEELRVPKATLLYQDEGANLLSKNNIENSGLCYAFNQLFYQSHYGKKVGQHEMRCYAKVSLLMGLTVDSPAEFAELFGKSTINGFFRRMLFADGPDNWVGRDNWVADPVELRPQSSISLPDNVAQMKTDWMQEDLKERKNLGELGLRAAILICSAENRKADRLTAGRSEIPGVRADDVWTSPVTKDDMSLGLMLAEYQQRLRRRYRPGIAENSLEARCTQTVLRGLEEVGVDVPISFRAFSRKHHLDRYGSATLQRVLLSLKSREVIEFGSATVGEGRATKMIMLIGGE